MTDRRPGRRGPAQAGEAQRDLTRRRRRRRLRRGRPLLVLLLLVVLVAAGVWVVAFSSVLDTRTVQVQGAGRVGREAVSTAASVPIGRPLLRVDLGAIERSVERLPAVR